MYVYTCTYIYSHQHIFTYIPTKKKKTGALRLGPGNNAMHNNKVIKSPKKPKKNTKMCAKKKCVGLGPGDNEIHDKKTQKQKKI